MKKNMKNKKQLFENIVHGIFLILGLITVGFVLLITVYLVVSGIPAIQKIGLFDFLFGQEWASTAENPKYGRCNYPWCTDRIFVSGLPCKTCTKKNKNSY